MRTLDGKTTGAASSGVGTEERKRSERQEISPVVDRPKRKARQEDWNE